MGNRAIITTSNAPDAVGIYLHWNGGPESVLAFLSAAQHLGVRDPSTDSHYFLARLTQVIANWMGGSISLGVGLVRNMDDSDNGVYTVGRDFKVMTRSRHDHRKTYASLDMEERAKCDKIAAEAVAASRDIFNKP